MNLQNGPAPALDIVVWRVVARHHCRPTRSSECLISPDSEQSEGHTSWRFLRKSSVSSRKHPLGCRLNARRSWSLCLCARTLTYTVCLWSSLRWPVEHLHVSALSICRWRILGWSTSLERSIQVANGSFDKVHLRSSSYFQSQMLP